MRAFVMNSVLVGLSLAFLLTAAQADSVAFRTVEGHYLSAEEGGGGKLSADRREVRGWETFRMIRLEGNRVLLLTERGFFLTAAAYGGEIRADAWNPGEEETFRMIRLQNDRVALETHRGYYLSVDDGEVRADGSQIGREETFEIMPQEGSGPPSAAGGPYGSGGGTSFGSPAQSRTVAIRLFNDRHLTVGRFDTSLTSTNQPPGYGETFVLERLGSDRVALRSPNGDYVTVDSYGYLEATAREVGQRETFRMRNQRGGKFALQAFNGLFVSGQSSGNRGLAADSRQVGQWESFELVRMGDDGSGSQGPGGYGPGGQGYGDPGGQGSGGYGNGYQDPQPDALAIVIQAEKGHLLSTDGPGRTLLANKLRANEATVFELITLVEHTPEKGDVALRVPDGTYISLDASGRLRAGASRIGGQETFQLRRETNGYSLKAANGRYVTAEDGGGRELKANRDLVKGWEIFRFVAVSPTGSGPQVQAPGGGASYRRVAFETEKRYYLGLESGGSRLGARAVAPGPGETFELIPLGEDRYALKAPNGRYLRAEGGGGAGLIADRTEVGEHETFRLVRSNEGRQALLTARSRFVSADQGGGSSVSATSYEARSWEHFRIVDRP